MADTRAGVQLPPNSTGLVTGAFPVRNPDDPSAAVWVPATVLVDANGRAAVTAAVAVTHAAPPGLSTDDVERLFADLEAFLLTDPVYA